MLYICDGATLFDWLGNVFVQICSKRTVRQMEVFAIFVKFVNFGCHNNYFRPGPRLLYARCSFKSSKGGQIFELSAMFKRVHFLARPPPFYTRKSGPDSVCETSSL